MKYACPNGCSSEGMGFMIESNKIKELHLRIMFCPKCDKYKEFYYDGE